MAKFKCGYDNFEDAKGKLAGTYCLYKGKAFTVGEVWPIDNQKPDVGEYKVVGKFMENSGIISCPIDDPEFNCSDYNIGYLNHYNHAAWYYRIPLKQYKQGLRYDQVSAKASDKNFYGGEFKPSKQMGAMLENRYPTVDQSVKLLRDQEASIMAFHRNFALTVDKYHDDFLIEYKGDIIGATKNFEDIKLIPECQHLYESLKEAMH